MGKGNGQNGGGVTYYRADSAGMNALSDYMLEIAHFAENITDIEDDLLKCIFNPMQYIISCMWFPFSPAVTTGGVYVGWWEAPISGLNRLTSGMNWSLSMTYTIPKHPKAATRGNYLNAAPYSRYHLYAGPFGVIPIDTSYLLGRSQLITFVKVDCVTGSGKLTIEDSSGNVLEEHFAQVGVPIQMGQNLLNQGAVGGVTGGFPPPPLSSLRVNITASTVDAAITTATALMIIAFTEFFNFFI
jgi:hypothetical protein